MMDQLEQFVRLSYQSGRGDAGWWLVGAVLKAAAETRTTIAAPHSQWDVNYAKAAKEYGALSRSGPNAVLLMAKARLLLEQALKESNVTGPAYLEALLQEWMNRIGQSAPEVSLASLQRAKETIPRWLVYIGASVAAAGIAKLLFGGGDASLEQGQGQTLVVQLPPTE